MNSLTSFSRIFLFAGLIAMFAHGAFAHTYLSSVYLNGAALPEGDCMRPHPSTAFDSPIPLVTSPDMTCGWLPQANNPANRKCPIAAGSTIGLQWHHNDNGPNDDIVDPSHVGPILVYLAKSDTGAGNVWFKIYEDGYTNGQWAVTKLIANKGRVDITLPADIAPGNYLLRGEILAHHGSYALNGVQPYVGCVELTVSGSGKATPAGVAIPGVYSNQDPGMLFDIYKSFTSYPIPGPAVYKSGSSSSSAPVNTPPVNTAAPATAAPKPAGTTGSAAPSTTGSAPKPAAGNIKVQLNGGTNEWWLGVAIVGAAETTVKVELKDSKSVTAWSALTDMSYAYVFDKSVKLTPPISLRLTSSSGKVVEMTNVFTSFTSALIDSGKNYGTASSTPSTTTSAPAATNAPATAAPTQKPSTTPTGANTKVTVAQGANSWWFAFTVSGNAPLSAVEIKDSGSVSNFVPCTWNGWSWTYQAMGSELRAPLTVRLTSGNKQVTATVASISVNSAAEANGQL